MGGYSGRATIKFTIERVLDPKTNELREVRDDDPEELEVQYIELTIEGESYFEPGVTWKRPEDCYPDEGDTQINSITSPGKIWDESDLTKKELKLVLEELDEEVASDDHFDEPDYDDHYDPYD